jgi:MOSC domain-containing protein YiiM
MGRMITGRVDAVLIAPDADSIVSVRQAEVQVSLAGFEGDRHAGDVYRAGSRTSFYARGTEIRNSRQVSLVSAEELAEVAAAMDIPHIAPEWLGANLFISGIPALTFLPPTTRLFFEQGAVLIVQGENSPCTTAGQAIQDQFPGRDDLANAFPSAGLHKRGIVAWVEHPGVIMAGDSVRAAVPDQVLYEAVIGE